MLRVEVTESNNQRSYVEFFDDDTIHTVRQQIGKTLDIHPDRLFILAKVERSKDYYKNPENWEALFNRLSLTEKTIQKVPFSEYQTFYRSPPTSIVFEEITRADWMEVPDSVKDLRTEFTEYMIFGVPESKSFCLPRNFNLSTTIPAAQYPIPDLTALVTDIKGFYCIPYTEEAEPVKSVYYPYLVDGTPSRLTREEVGLLEKNEEKIKGLLALKSPKPSKVSILRTRFHIPWIETDFGAVRARFEQMFYGLTVSKDIPSITLFTSQTEMSRHKFFTKEKKKPFLDLSVWNSWWTNTKPSRNRPTLILYRGKDSQYFDRVSITSIDMVVSTYRPEGNTETIDELKEGVQEWMKSFDSILPFINENDLDMERWKLQDMSFVAKYDEKLEEYDLRRFPCLTSIFDIADAQVFRFLRTDFSVQGVTAVEMKILQIMRSNVNVNIGDIAKELGITTERARGLYQGIQKRIDEEPDLLNKAFRGFPTMKISPTTILLSSTNRLEKSLEYANILRYVLSDASEVDKICPKRMEKVEARTVHVEEVIEEDYMNLDDFDIGPSDDIVVEEKEEKKISVRGGPKTMYNYFNIRLQKFDPLTYDPSNKKYPKICEHDYQPIILNDTELEKLNGTPYDPEKLEENQKMKVEDPSGLVICPEYWCMRDELPLREDQLLNTDGFQRCPKCKGKVASGADVNPQDFPVRKRDKAYKYPRLTKFKSPTNGRLMPCCYSTDKTGKQTDATSDKYYILGETKNAVPPLRLSYIPKQLLDSLFLKETYELFRESTRIQTATSGYFRVGIGRPSETLPKILGFLKPPTIPSPREKPELTMKCSFFPTWAKMGEDFEDIEEDIESEPLAKRIAGIDEAFKKNTLTIVQELEYTALVLKCDVFRVVNNSFECFFQTRMNKKERGVLILQDGEVYTAVSFVSRTGNNLKYSSNVYENPFGDETHKELERLQSKACATKIPSYENAVSALGEISNETYSVILDPYTRGQALYIPGKVILPFQATSVDHDSKLNGFENAKELPDHGDVLKYLEIAQKHSPGFAWAEDMYSFGELVEVRLKSGLRIPVVPEEGDGEPSEVTETVNSVNERKMTFGEGESQMKPTYRDISYSTEVYEFLLFELSKSLSDYPELQRALKSGKKIELELTKWFMKTTRSIDISKPTEFVSKIRTPCGQFKKESCSGNVCGWNGTCKVEIKSTRKDSILKRFVSSLVENAKIRAMVLEERVTPFFGTILYMELPHELILTDADVKV